MFNKTIRLPNRRVTVPLKAAERVKLCVSMPGDIEPKSNPFLHDRVSMGTVLTDNWLAMFTSEKPTETIDLYNTETGQRFKLDIVPENEVLAPVISIRKEDEFVNGQLYSAIMHNDITEFVEPMTAIGEDHPFYVAFGDRLLFDFTKLMAYSPEEIRAAIDDNVFDDELVESLYTTIAQFIKDTIEGTANK